MASGDLGIVAALDIVGSMHCSRTEIRSPGMDMAAVGCRGIAAVQAGRTIALVQVATYIHNKIFGEIILSCQYSFEIL